MKVYRIQPAGLGLHTDGSDRSAGGTDPDGYLDAFEYAWQVVADFWNTNYGDEILEIEVDETFDNNDEEGVCFDPKCAKIKRRWTWQEFFKLFGANNFDEIQVGFINKTIPELNGID